ncbi:MAG: hypothetical protein JWQ28_684 [Pedobacter sp.]|nr:hypothetical protein [Pedobacter sp.]
MKKSPAKRVVYVAEDKRLYDYVTVVQINSKVQISDQINYQILIIKNSIIDLISGMSL